MDDEAQHERSDAERAAEREAEAAAAEAGAIGGPGPDYEAGPAEQAVVEGGGGVAEGFEEAERELREHAEHGDGGRDPLADAPEPEPEAGRVTAADGEADHIRSATPDDGA